jgi:hypothetical protein
MLNVTIFRGAGDSKQTLGRMVVHDDCYNDIYECKTLELADKNNQNSISRIPAGTYDVVKRTSPKFKDHFHLTYVRGRKWILIHSGNTHKNTRGCILVGSELQDIDGDTYLDVTHSKDTLAKLRELLPESFQLHIRDEV